MRRTERTPIEVNAANRQKMALGACIPLYTEGNYERFIKGTALVEKDITKLYTLIMS